MAVAGCGGASDIADAPTSSDVTSPTSSQPSGPIDGGPTVQQIDPATPNNLAGLPDGFGQGPPGKGLDRFLHQKVDWQPCSDGECADIWVPLDYDDPDGLAITLKAKRQVATDPSQ